MKVLVQLVDTTHIEQKGPASEISTKIPRVDTSRSLLIETISARGLKSFIMPLNTKDVTDASQMVDRKLVESQLSLVLTYVETNDKANNEAVKRFLQTRKDQCKIFSSGTCPGLRLDDLTRNDIMRYVRDKLEGNGTFRNLRCREGDKCDVLVDEVVEKAHGVFLWVFLVVRSLTLGLANADRIVDLQRRLRSLPDDLEEYLQHVLDTIDQNHQQ